MAVVGTRILRKSAGSLPAGVFGGTPKKAAVAFATPFPSAAYTVTIGIQVSGSKVFPYAIENKTVAGFTVAFCANTITGLVQVDWQAILEGDEL